jgi:hypothetical protein
MYITFQRMFQRILLYIPLRQVLPPALPPQIAIHFAPLLGHHSARVALYQLATYKVY